MVLHVFISFLGRVPLCIPYGLYSGTSLGGTTRGILGGFPGRVLSRSDLGAVSVRVYIEFISEQSQGCPD